MTSDDLTPTQLATLAARTSKQRDYLTRLRDRMNALGFPTADPLYAAVARALDAISNLTVIAASKANRPRRSPRREPTIMERKPWGGEG